MKVRSPRDGVTFTNHPAASRVVAALLGFLLAIALSSCSLFVTPPPPGSVASTATALKDTLRKTVGITHVSVTVAPRDSKDGWSLDNPGAWLINVYVTAQASTIDVHSLVSALATQLDAARRVAPVGATLQLTGDGLPNAALQFDSGGSKAALNEFVDAVIRLRTLTGIQAVDGSFGGPEPVVTVNSPVQWLDTVAQLRTLDGFGKGSLAAVVVHGPDAATSGAAYSWITIDTSTPDDATLAGLSKVVSQPGVTSLSYDAVRPPGSLDNWRPHLTVDTKSRKAVAAVLSRLTSFDQTAAPVPGIPRATFRLSGAEGDTDGYLGLPLGAAEPRDLVPEAEAVAGARRSRR